MDTYYSRHTMIVGIDQSTRQRLWQEGLVAVHAPHEIDGAIPKGPDNVSLNPNDHDTGGKRRVRAIRKLAERGGYVYAEYHLSDSDVRYIVGKVVPDSKIEVLNGTWGVRYDQGDRPAALLFVRMTGAIVDPPHFKGAPPHSTLCRWPSAGCVVEDLLSD